MRQVKQPANDGVLGVAGGNPAEKAQHDHIVTLVERMLDLNRQRATVLAPPDQAALDRQIAATDRQIDQAVYALYGLTATEIALVEGE